MINLQLPTENWNLQVLKHPFNIYKLCNVFKEDFVKGLEEELSKLPFRLNIDDLFSIKQTQDLYGLKYKSKYPFLSRFIEFLNNIRKFLMNLFSITLKDEISVSGSRYDIGDFLLCHDDKLEDRAVAFIFYLNDNWNSSWGGSLDLFDKDELYGQPSDIVYRVYPEFNTLLFFKVGDDTFHQVAEVLADVSRLTINGWFHYSHIIPLEPILLPDIQLTFRSPISLSATLTLNHMISKFDFDEAKTVLNDTGSVTIPDFLKPAVYDKIECELSSENIVWQKLGPANLRRYYVTSDVSVLHVTRTFEHVLLSKPMVSFIYSLVYDKEEMGNEETFIHIEFQKWKPSCYLLANAYFAEQSLPSIDLFLFLRVSRKNETDDSDEEEDEDEICGSGNIYYINQSSSDTLQEVRPENNCLYIVKRNAGEKWFVSYLSNLIYSGKYFIIHASYYKM